MLRVLGRYSGMRPVRIFESSFQKVVVWKSNLATEFRVSGAIHASFHKRRFLTGLTWDVIAAATLLRPAGEPKNILMLGVAGGTTFRTLRHLMPEVELTGIDLDGELIKLANEEMELAETGAEIIIEDAYEWLKKNKRRFDVIIDDLYLAGDDDVYRTRSCDGKWLDLVGRSLAPGGILVTNLVIGSGHRRVQSETRKALLEHFPCVRSLRTEMSMNEVLVAGEDVLSRRQLMKYTDRFPSWRDKVFWRCIEVRKL